MAARVASAISSSPRATANAAEKSLMAWARRARPSASAVCSRAQPARWLMRMPTASITPNVMRCEGFNGFSPQRGGTCIRSKMKMLAATVAMDTRGPSWNAT